MSFGHMCFFFKQKTEYEMRISDWSSDVCSSDLYTFEHYEIASNRILMATPTTGCGARTRPCTATRPTDATASTWPEASATPRLQIGRASCRERVCQYGQLTVVAVSIKNKKQKEMIENKNKKDPQREEQLM